MKYDTSKLKRARLEAGINIQEMAIKVGVSLPTISRIEKGETQLPSTIRKYAVALNVPLADLIVDDPTPESIDRKTA